MSDLDRSGDVSPPPIQVVTANQTSSRESAEVSDPTAPKSEHPQVPSTWWMVTVSVIALIALAGQGTSLFGLLSFHEERARFSAEVLDWKSVQSEREQMAEQCRKDIARLKEERALLQGKFDNLSTDYESASQELRAEEAKLKTIKDAFDTLMVDGRKTRAELDLAASKKRDIDESVVAAEKKKSTLDAEIVALTTTRDSLEKSVAESTTTFDKLNAEIERCRTELGRLDGELVKTA